MIRDVPRTSKSEEQAARELLLPTEAICFDHRHLVVSRHAGDAWGCGSRHRPSRYIRKRRINQVCLGKNRIADTALCTSRTHASISVVSEPDTTAKRSLSVAKYVEAKPNIGAT